MSDCACMAHEETRCPCHVSLAVRMEAIGLTLDSLTATELALVDALLPAGEWRSKQRLGAAVGWITDDERRTAHLIRVNVARIRPTLHAVGWDLQIHHGTGHYRIKRCSADVAANCPHAPHLALSADVCKDCGEPRYKGTEYRRMRRCGACLAIWRSKQQPQAGVPRCTACGELLISRLTTLCKRCRGRIPSRLCEECAAPIGREGATGLCNSCAARRTLAQRRAS